MKKQDRRPARQGDVLIIPISKLPDGLLEAPRDRQGRVILAEGEVTGHAHAILDDPAENVPEHVCDLDDLLGALRELRESDAYVLNERRWGWHREGERT